MTVLVIDKDTNGFGRKIVESLKSTNPGLEYELSPGAKPFLELQDINDGKYSAIVIGLPAECRGSTKSEHDSNVAVEWIEALRFGAVWEVDWTKSGKYAIRETTKSSLPIIYVHRYSIMNIDEFPGDFPDVYANRYGQGRLKKFVHKWYKSIGCNCIVLTPWEPSALAEAMNEVING